MPDKKRDKRPAEAVEAKPVKYRAIVGLTNDRTHKSYGPGDVLTAEDFDPQVLAHWAEIRRVVAL